MEEQSDTPRMSIKFSGELGMSLLNRIAQLERERDGARALNVEWSKKAETWMASPEAAQRLQGYRELGQQVAKAQNERDEARAELETERLRLAACGVVAMANTPESAARARDILPVHFSASLQDVMRAVDREMDLRAEVERLRALQAACIAWRGAREIPVPDGHRAALHASEQVYAALAATEAKP